MMPISYVVGKIPITVALQVMARLKAAHIPATMTPTDQDSAAIEVALIDRGSLDDLLAPIEARIRRENGSIDAALPFAELHATIMDSSYQLGSGSEPHDEFTNQLTDYQTWASQARYLDRLADTCNRRIAKADLPLDLLAAYSALSRLARWRAEQLRSGK